MTPSGSELTPGTPTLEEATRPEPVAESLDQNGSESSVGHPPPPEPPEQTGGEPDDRLATLFVIVFWAGVGVIIALSNETSRGFVAQYWWAVSAVVVLIAVVALMPFGRRWLRGRGASTRAGLVIFVGVPALLAIVGSVAVLPQAYQLTALRVVFLVVVCLLPATMWYLFIATRKASLLNEFLANLDRLGLLQAGHQEDSSTRNRRVSSYLQKFEAVYGDLPEKIHDDVLHNDFHMYSKAEASGSTGLSTTTVPVMLSTVLIALGWLITLPPAEVIYPSTGDPFADPAAPWVWALEPPRDPITLAFLGAYFFSLQMLFRRYVLKDLRGSAYVAVAMRIILAVIGIWVLMTINGSQEFLSEDQMLVAGFALGVFPRVIWQVIESIFKTIAGIALPSMRSGLPVSDLDGLTVWHEARLEEEDIENVPNMATADLVELLLNTRIPPERIIDWVDQAILYTQVGSADKKGPDSTRNKLRSHGIRTATSLLQSSAEAQRQGSRQSFDKILTNQSGISPLPALEASLTTNCNLRLIQRWRNMPADTPTRPSANRRASIHVTQSMDLRPALH